MVKKEKKFTHQDVPSEWREAVKARAIEQEVDEDSVIRFGLHHDFKKAKKDEERAEERLSLLREIRDGLKKK